MEFRFTIPSRYQPGTPGHASPSERQGYYQQGASESDAKQKLVQHLHEHGETWLTAAAGALDPTWVPASGYGASAQSFHFDYSPRNAPALQAE